MTTTNIFMGRDVIVKAIVAVFLRKKTVAEQKNVVDMKHFFQRFAKKSARPLVFTLLLRARNFLRVHIVRSCPLLKKTNIEKNIQNYRI